MFFVTPILVTLTASLLVLPPGWCCLRLGAAKVSAPPRSCCCHCDHCDNPRPGPQDDPSPKPPKTCCCLDRTAIVKADQGQPADDLTIAKPPTAIEAAPLPSAEEVPAPAPLPLSPHSRHVLHCVWLC